MIYRKQIVFTNLILNNFKLEFKYFIFEIWMKSGKKIFLFSNKYRSLPSTTKGRWTRRVEVSVKCKVLELMCRRWLWENIEDNKYKDDIKPIKHDMNKIDTILEKYLSTFLTAFINQVPVAINAV